MEFLAPEEGATTGRPGLLSIEGMRYAMQMLRQPAHNEFSAALNAHSAALSEGPEGIHTPAGDHSLFTDDTAPLYVRQVTVEPGKEGRPAVVCETDYSEVHLAGRTRRSYTDEAGKAWQETCYGGSEEVISCKPLSVLESRKLTALLQQKTRGLAT